MCLWEGGYASRCVYASVCPHPGVHACVIVCVRVCVCEIHAHTLIHTSRDTMTMLY